MKFIFALWRSFVRFFARAPRRLFAKRVTIARRLDGTPASAWQAHRADECHGKCWYCENHEAPRPIQWFYKHPVGGKNHRERRAMFAKAGRA